VNAPIATPDIEKLLREIDARTDDMTALAQDLIRFPIGPVPNSWARVSPAAA